MHRRIKMNFVLLLLFYFNGSVQSLEYEFPKNFKFGVATSAYQIEGAWNEDGKGENIWDKFTHDNPNSIKDHSNSDISCDSYHKFSEDIKDIAWLGVDFYRFSISWSRILPNGYANQINPKGVRYYNQLIDSLLANNITPLITLHHWDLPQPLQEIGGWTNPFLINYFEDYARIVFKLFGDKVKMWLTFNEPFYLCVKGYGDGSLAPGRKGMGTGEYMCGRNILLAHARVYHLYNNSFKPKQNGKVSIAINGEWMEPKTNTTEDHEAAERRIQFHFGWWANPIYSKSGNYPQIMIDTIGNKSKEENFPESRLIPFTPDQIKYIKGTSDFFGLNQYTASLVSPAKNSSLPGFFNDTGVIKSINPKWPKSEISSLSVAPWAFRKMLNWIKKEYDNPVVIVTENGYSEKARVDDTNRINFIQSYLQNLLKAIHDDGCNVQGYIYWSLLDNFEWTSGYRQKFGLFYVNFTDPSRPRTSKASAHVYKSIISARKLKLN